jgi:asparagine synthase (glutamine-hydrolysing)
MCGIAGKMTPGRAADRDTVEAMCAALRHRGPDSSGIHVRDQVALGVTRLAVIDLVAGDQPMYSEDGAVTLVLNGEIYNHGALRSELIARGHRFASRSDAEVVVHLWEEEGEACVERLHGMFAFAIWDQRRQQLFLARDRLGKKPLVYHLAHGGIAFASELRSLLQDPEAPREIDPEAIDAFLTHQYVPHERCAFRGINKLAPATTLSWRAGESPRLHRYWRLEYEPKLALAAGEARERLRELILDATRARLQSDVPLGAFLSGGIDSGAVVAAMAMVSPEPVRTFTATFAEADFDEREHARRVAERYGTDHRELEVGAPDASLLPRIAWQFGEPFADPAALPTFQLAELTRRHVTVCLCGDGGDEGFAGYGRYWQIRATLAADVVPEGARRGLARALGTAAGDREGKRALPRAARLARRLALPPGRRFADLGRWFSDADRHRVYGPTLREALATDPLAEVERAWLAGDRLGGADRGMATDLETYLPDDLLTKVDIATMAHSLEVRAPLLDHRLLEFAARLPERLKLRGTSGKLLLREAVRPWLPAGLAERPKHGFSVPIGEWLRGELRSLPEEVLLDPASRARGLFVDREVERMIEAHRAGRDRAQQLWAMVNLELWFRTCVDRPPVHARAEAPALL